MFGEDQERFEDYLELERYIEELQAGRAGRLPRDLTPEQARIYHMAALFHAASPEAAEPRPEFVAQLQARLLAEEPTEKRAIIRSQKVPESQQEALPAELPAAAPQPPVKGRPARFVSRRALLAGGAVAAASLAAGTGLGAALRTGGQGSNQAAGDQTAEATESYDSAWLVQSGANGIQTTWHFVTTVAQLGKRAVQFVAGGVIGYVILKDSNGQNAQDSSEVVALSAACTHMGCIVQWHDADRRFHCPCHGGLFTEYGTPDKGSPLRYLASLPRLRTKIENGNIYVEVPKIDT